MKLGMDKEGKTVDTNPKCHKGHKKQNKWKLKLRKDVSVLLNLLFRINRYQSSEKIDVYVADKVSCIQ